MMFLLEVARVEGMFLLGVAVVWLMLLSGCLVFPCPELVIHSSDLLVLFLLSIIGSFFVIVFFLGGFAADFSIFFSVADDKKEFISCIFTRPGRGFFGLGFAIARGFRTCSMILSENMF